MQSRLRHSRSHQDPKDNQGVALTWQQWRIDPVWAGGLHHADLKHSPKHAC